MEILKIVDFGFETWWHNRQHLATAAVHFPSWLRSQLWLCKSVFWFGYGSIPINAILRGMNIHQSQLFWCEQKGYKVLTHPHLISSELLLSCWLLCCMRQTISRWRNVFSADSDSCMDDHSACMMFWPWHNQLNPYNTVNSHDFRMMSF